MQLTNRCNFSLAASREYRSNERNISHPVGPPSASVVFNVNIFVHVYRREREKKRLKDQGRRWKVEASKYYMWRSSQGPLKVIRVGRDVWMAGGEEHESKKKGMKVKEDKRMEGFVIKSVLQLFVSERLHALSKKMFSCIFFLLWLLFRGSVLCLFFLSIF